MQVDQLDGIKRLHDKNIDLSDDNLNAACDRVSKNKYYYLIFDV